MAVLHQVARGAITSPFIGISGDLVELTELFTGYWCRIIPLGQTSSIAFPFSVCTTSHSGNWCRSKGGKLRPQSSTTSPARASYAPRQSGPTWMTIFSFSCSSPTAARDQGFQRIVVSTYDHRCALCGVRIITPEGHTFGINQLENLIFQDLTLGR